MWYKASMFSLLITKWEEEYEYRDTGIPNGIGAPSRTRTFSSKTEFLAGKDERKIPSSLLNEDLLTTWWLSEAAGSFTSYSNSIPCNLAGEFSSRLFGEMLGHLYMTKLQLLHNNVIVLWNKIVQVYCTELFLGYLKLPSKSWFPLAK